MGSGRWNDDDWDAYTTSARAAYAAGGLGGLFTSRSLHADLDPRGFACRESRDSADNPSATPIILASDVTGSMGALAAEIITQGMGLIMGEIHQHKPVPDPHLLCAAIGDAQAGDRAPFQATQFEATLCLAGQMEKFFIEGGGGGNDGESYNLAWYFAAFKTRCDAILKRRGKGYLFTIGDEPMLPTLTRADARRVFGDDLAEDMPTRDLLTVVARDWEVFHLNVLPGRHSQDSWRSLLGQRLLTVTDPSKLGEVVVSTIRLIEGEPIERVAATWSGSTSLVVADAVRGLAPRRAGGAGLVRL